MSHEKDKEMFTLIDLAAKANIDTSSPNWHLCHRRCYRPEDQPAVSAFWRTVFANALADGTPWVDNVSEFASPEGSEFLQELSRQLPATEYRWQKMDESARNIPENCPLAAPARCIAHIIRWDGTNATKNCKLLSKTFGRTVESIARKLRTVPVRINPPETLR